MLFFKSINLLQFIHQLAQKHDHAFTLPVLLRSEKWTKMATTVRSIPLRARCRVTEFWNYRHIQQAIFTFLDEESESEVKKCQILELGGKNQKKTNVKPLFVHFLFFKFDVF